MSEAVDNTGENALSLKERAEHEAGHYVILYVLEIEHTPKYIALARSGSSGGCCCFHTHEPLALEHAAIQGLGGLAANIEGIRRKGYSEEDPRHQAEWRLAAQGAWTDVDDLKKRFEQHDEFFVPFLEKATEIVRAYWELVEAVSAQLQERGVLYHEEPKLIMEAIRKRDVFTTSMLEVYRLLRREDSTSEDLPDFKSRYPDLPWFESLQDFLRRKAWVGNAEATRIIALAQRDIKRERSLAALW